MNEDSGTMLRPFQFCLMAGTVAFSVSKVRATRPWSPVVKGVK